MIEWCLQDSSIKMLFAGHEIRDSTKAIRVAARVVFLCVNLFFRAFFHNFPILATDGKTADTQQDGSNTANRNSKQQEQSQKHKGKRQETEELTEGKVQTRGAEHVPLSCGRQYISLRIWENGDLVM